MKYYTIVFVAVMLAAPTFGYAQSGAIDIHKEFARAHKACISYLTGPDDRSIRSLSSSNYRVKKRGKGLSAYLESSRAIPRHRRPSIEVFTGKKFSFRAEKTCQIFVSGVSKDTDEALHRSGLATLLKSGYTLQGRGKGRVHLTKNGVVFDVSGVSDRGLFKLIMSKL